MAAVEHATSTVTKPQKFARYRSVRRGGSRDLTGVETILGPTPVPAFPATSDSTVKRTPSRYHRPARNDVNNIPLPSNLLTQLPMQLAPKLSPSLSSNGTKSPSTSSPVSATSHRSFRTSSDRIRPEHSTHQRRTSCDVAREEALQKLEGGHVMRHEAQQPLNTSAGKVVQAEKCQPASRHGHTKSISRYHGSADGQSTVHPDRHGTARNRALSKPGSVEKTRSGVQPVSDQSADGRRSGDLTRPHAQHKHPVKPLLDFVEYNKSILPTTRRESLHQSSQRIPSTTYVGQPLLTDVHDTPTAFTTGSLLASTDKSANHSIRKATLEFSPTASSFAPLPSSLLANSAERRRQSGSTSSHGVGREEGKPLLDIQFNSEFTDGSLLNRMETMKVSGPVIDRHKYVEGVVKVGEGYD